MKLFRTIALALLLATPLMLQAQTKAEKSLYAKTMKKPSVKAADKFLKKYPESVLAPKVLNLKDSLIRDMNTSAIPHDEALRLAGPCLDAAGWRKDGVERIAALDPDLTLRVLSPDGTQQFSRTIPLYTLETTGTDGSDAALAVTLAQPLEVISPLGSRYWLHFAYRGGDSEYVEVLYLPDEDILHQAMFYGTPLPEGRIEGQSPEAIEGLELTAEVLWLKERLDSNPLLVPVSEADLLTDASIRWWLEKNARAKSRLSFGALDPGSSIVAAYKKAAKEKGKSYNAACFNIRGYTVICAGSKKTGEYLLIWCEPVCKNKKRDKYLNSIYFENDGTTLDLFYYKGNSTSKTKISLATQKIY